MLVKIKIFVGMILLIASVIYIVRRPGVSMMESAIQGREKRMQKLQEEQEKNQQQSTDDEMQESKQMC